MSFIEQEIKGVWVIEPQRFGDKRGYFCEVFKQAEFEAHIGHINFLQDNESLSKRGVVRGLHFQRGEWSQAKLVRVSQGCVLDVVVDLRQGSPTWGKYLAVELSADTGRQLFIPRGFAHGFAVLSDVAQFQYKVDNTYAPQSEATLRYDDPTVNIDWQIAREDMLLSDKDLNGLPLSAMTPEFLGF